MCMLCPDYVTSCAEESCRGTRRRVLFFLGDQMCEHLAAQYGTKLASLLDHVERGDHEDDCGEVCDFEKWKEADAAEVRRVVLAVEKESGG